MKTMAAYLGLRAQPGDIPFGSASRKRQAAMIVIGGAVIGVLRSVLGW